MGDGNQVNFSRDECKGLHLGRKNQGRWGFWAEQRYAWGKIRGVSWTSSSKEGGCGSGLHPRKFSVETGEVPAAPRSAFARPHLKSRLHFGAPDAEGSW